MFNSVKDETKREPDNVCTYLLFQNKKLYNYAAFIFLRFDLFFCQISVEKFPS